MTLLAPLGLLALLSIVILIIIYIIKPNYQQKMISSTFVWKLSLKYRKRKIPTSKLRDLLIIICQILILVCLAAVLTQPAQILKMSATQTEVIAIIDSSASMRTAINEVTRYERAVDDVIDFSDEILDENGIVSVIVAENQPYFLEERVNAEGRETLKNSLNSLVGGEKDCSFGSADMDKAISLCKDIVLDNPDAKIYVYTDTKYDSIPEGITVVDVTDDEEWNAAILDAYAEVVDGYYNFTIEVACYGVDREIEVNLDVYGVNAANKNEAGKDQSFSYSVYCKGDETKTIVFKYYSDNEEDNNSNSENVEYWFMDEDYIEKIYSYQDIYISIEEEDSYPEDNNFFIFGGQKDVVRIQYASALPNPFMQAVLDRVKAHYQDRWDIQITEVKLGEYGATENFDFYIFEDDEIRGDSGGVTRKSVMPESLPTDGVVLLINPSSAPSGSDMRIEDGYYDYRGEGIPLTQETNHAVLKSVVAGNVTVSRVCAIENYDSSYELVLSSDNHPALLVRNESDCQVAVLGFSLHYSNLPMTEYFVYMMYNIFGYYFPSTVDGNAFEVYEDVELNARSNSLTVSMGEAYEQTFESFPATVKFNTPGTYTLTQTTYYGDERQELIYVKIPAVESNIYRKEERLLNPYQEIDQSEYFRDLLFYIAIALVAFLFVEWWLQSREGM